MLINISIEFGLILSNKSFISDAFAKLHLIILVSLTNFDFNVLLKTHVEDKNQITVATWHHEVAIPYGVVESTGNGKIHINEKPTMAFPISTGINVINREYCKKILVQLHILKM